MVYESISTDVGPASSEGIPSVSIVGSESAYQRAAASVPSFSGPTLFPATAGQVGTRFTDLITSNPNWGIKPMTPGTTVSVNPATLEAGISLLDMIQAFAFRGSGFDFRFNPVFETSAGNIRVGELYMISTLGAARPNAVFEFGHNTRANIASYSWKRLAGEHLANNIGVPPTGDSGSLGEGVSGVNDTDSVAIYGVRHRFITSDFAAKALRDQIASDHLLFRKGPRRVLTITPTADMGLGNVPTPLVDYVPGDTVPVRILDNGVSLVSGSLRVYGIALTLDKDGKETAELEVSPETTV